MFYSLMAILHMQLPVAQNFFTLQRKFRNYGSPAKRTNLSSSRIVTIASPKMMSGLKLPGKFEPNTTKVNARKFTFTEF